VENNILILIFQAHEEQLKLVRRNIEEQEAKLINLQQEKRDLFETFKKSLQMKHQQQLQQQQQKQQQKQPQ